MKKRDEESAFSAICNAQRIACAPFEFENGVRQNVTHENRLVSPE